MGTRGGQHLEETLDRHGSFVRRLASSLVFDENRAEDVAQQTWLAAVQHPPRQAATARGWLARVARNFSFRMRREDARREAREMRAARPEIAPSARATPVDAAMLREVIDAVLTLDEPYRSTVLMRFYENLEPAEIAARLGVPAATVRTRLKRALDGLRDRFDAQHGGNRRAWTAPLLPIACGAWKPAAAAAAAGGAVAASAAPALSGITLGGLLMAKKIALVSGLAALAVVSAVIATRAANDAPDPVEPPHAAVTIAEAPPVPVEAPAAKPAESGAITARTYVPSGEEMAPAEVQLAPKGAPSATIVGRVTDQRGTPQANVPVLLRTLDQVTQFAGMTSQTNVSNERTLQTVTAADGRFSFAQLPLNVEARVRARPEKLCDATRPASVTKAGVIDVGDLVAMTGGSIAGTVLNPQGLPVRNCKVSASSTGGAASPAPGVLAFSHLFDPDARSSTTNAQGQYRIDGLPEGECAVAAVADEHPGETKRNVRVRANETTWETDFKLSQGVTLAGVVRDADGRPMPEATVVASAGEMKFGPEESPATGPRKATTGPDGRFLLQGLRQDPVTVRARKAGFVTATQRNVTPGVDLALTLRSCGVLFGHVRNAATNEPLAEFSLGVVSEPSLDGPSRARVLRGPEAAKAAQVAESPGLFAVVDLPEAAVRLRAHAEGFAESEQGPVRVAPGEKSGIDVLLAPQARVRGFVVDAANNPVAGARIAVGNAKAEPMASPGGDMRFRARRRVISKGDPAADAEEPSVARTVTSGDDGSFTIGSLPGGTFRVSATHREFAGSAPVEVSLQPGGLVEGVKLVLEMGGTFAGSALDPDGNKLPGARIRLRPKAGDEESQRGMGGPNEEPGISDANGDFEITGLRPGEYLASLGDVEGEASVYVSFSDDRQTDGVPVTIEAGRTVRKNLQQKPRSSLTGLVKEGGKPAPGVRVSLAQKDVPEFLGLNATKTDENGMFTMDKVVPGDYTLVVDPPGAPLPVRKPVTLVPRSDQRVTVDLPTGSIEGRVTDKTTGKPLAGVTLSAMVEEAGEGAEPQRVTRGIVVMATADEEGGDIQTISVGGASEPVRTDAEGRYRLRYVAPGKYRISIKGASLMPQSRSGVVVEEGRTTKDVDFGAERGASLVVTVDPAGRDVIQVFGFLNAEGGNDGPEVASGTVKNGIKFTGLKPGRYHLRVDAPMSDLEGRIDVDVLPGEEAKVTVRLAERE